MATLTAALTRRQQIAIALKPAAILGGLIVLMVALRAWLAFRYMGGEVDWGAYLLSVHYVQGFEPTHADRLRPLLGPGYLLWPFVSAFGNENGLRVWSVIFSFAYVYPMWLVARRFLTEWQSLGVVFFVLVDLILAEMFVTGVLPLIAFGLILMVIWALIGLRERWRWREGIIGAVSLGLIAHTNQTSSGLALLYVPIFTVAIWQFWGKDRSYFRRMFVMLAAGGLLALTALPWYGEVHPGGATLRFPGPLISFGGPLTFDWWKAYAGFITAGLVLWHTRKEAQPILKSLAVLLIASSFMRMFSSHDEALMNMFYRSQHISAFFIYPCLAWLVWRVWWPRFNRFWKVAGGAAGVVVAVFMLWGFIHNVQFQSFYSRMVSPDTMKAIDYINTHGGTGKVDTDSNSLGLYVAALTNRKVAWVTIEAPPRAWESMHWASLCIWGSIFLAIFFSVGFTPLGALIGWRLSNILQPGPLWMFWRRDGKLIPITPKDLSTSYGEVMRPGGKAERGPMVFMDEFLCEMLERRNLKNWLTRIRTKGMQKLALIMLVWLAIAFTGFLFLFFMAMQQNAGRAT